MTIAPAAAERVLEVGIHGLAVRLRCADGSTAVALAERFAAFPAPAPGAQPAVDVDFHLGVPLHAEPRDGRLVYESEHARALYSPGEDALYAFHAGGGSLRCDPVTGSAELVSEARSDETTWLLTRPLLTLALMEILRARGLHPLHAATLAGPGGGIVVCGPSGAGKSTLALALATAGLDYLGDDLALLRPRPGGVEVLGFPDELGLVGGPPRPGWPKGRLAVADAIPPARVREGCVPRLVVALSETAGNRVPEPVDPDAALLELVPSILLTEPRRVQAHLDALATLVASATLWRMAVRPDLEAVVEHVSAFLGTEPAR